MRQIDKGCTLSTAYKMWVDELEANSFSHPAYDSSKNEFYWDVVMNLFHCQGGLCAYTEMLLCPKDLYTGDKWERGRYRLVEGQRPQVRGQLEHFDRRLKEAKAWLWENLFMVDTDINTKVKKLRTVDPILKPDSDRYDPFVMLEYDASTNVFFAHSTLNVDVKRRVTEMIIALGLNFDPVRELRRIYLASRLKEIEFGLVTWDELEQTIEQFPTAFAMIKIAAISAR